MSTLENAGPARIPDTVFAQVSPDPLRPTDVQIPQNVSAAPPCCPICFVFLHPIDQNAHGDILFECMTDHATGPGYMAVYRAALGEYEQRPGTEMRRWAPPLTYVDVQRRLAEQRAARQPVSS